ncbi:MAG: ATP-binding protein [Acidobacteriota bacterium]|nr:ATP-binding protein [Acidobacteriota bacterium]
MAFKLHVVPNNQDEFDMMLEDEPIVIGRSANVDLVLRDQAVSRCHTRLYIENGRLFVEDLKSANGTLLNGHVVKEPTEAGPGDVLQLSGNVITIHREYQKPMSTTAMERTEIGEHTLFRDAAELLHKKLSPEEAQDSYVLGRYAARLRVLNDLHGKLSKQSSKNEVIRLVMDMAFANLEPEEGSVFLKSDNGELEMAASRAVPGLHENFLYSKSLIAEVTEKGKAALVLDARSDIRFQASVSIHSAGVRSLIAAPIFDAEGIMGMIALNSRSGVRWFTEEDLAFLVSLASVAALKTRNLAATEQLRELNRTLEHKVEERTRELAAANEELRAYNEMLERTRDQLVRQEKMASLGTLTSGIAHELKNPLNFVNNFASVARDHAGELKEGLNKLSRGFDQETWDDVIDLLDDLQQTTELIDNHGQRADKIVGRMMKFTQHESGTENLYLINPLVEEFSGIAHKGKQSIDDHTEVPLILELDPAAGEVLGVARDMGRVILNLVSNALDAIRARDMQKESGYEPNLLVRTARDKDGVTITIQDNGEGIDPRNLERIFTPFFTTRPTNSEHIGLGLSISYDLVIKTGGDLSVDSTQGEGSTFTITLPD